LGASVNTCKQCQKRWSGGALAVGCVGGDFGQEIVYFGGSRVHYTHLGCFGAPGGAGAGAKWFENVFQKSGLPNLESGASEVWSGSGLLLGSLGLGFHDKNYIYE
jgi:hypothetical protein